MTLLRDEYWFRGERVPYDVGAPVPMAVERQASVLGMEVEGLQRRPPTEVGGLGLDYYRDPFPHSLLRTRQLKHSKFRVSGLGLRSHFCEAFAYGHTH